MKLWWWIGSFFTVRKSILHFYVLLGVHNLFHEIRWQWSINNTKIKNSTLRIWLLSFHKTYNKLKIWLTLLPLQIECRNWVDILCVDIATAQYFFKKKDCIKCPKFSYLHDFNTYFLSTWMLWDLFIFVEFYWLPKISWNFFGINRCQNSSYIFIFKL